MPGVGNGVGQARRLSLKAVAFLVERRELR
jgi:hypothetical protein